jgi:hypothetical protein
MYVNGVCAEGEKEQFVTDQRVHFRRGLDSAAAAPDAGAQMKWEMSVYCCVWSQ